VALGISCFFLLIDSPALSGSWLEPDEIRFLELQMFIKDGGRFGEEKEEGFMWKDLKMVLCNWRLYMQAYMLLCNSACSYGMFVQDDGEGIRAHLRIGTKFTLPTITKGMGFSNTNAQLMTVPPYVAGALSCIFFGKLSDRFFWRLPFVAVPLSLVFIGYAVVISLDGDLGGHIGPAFFAIILTCMGIFPIQPAGSSWAANNLAPSSRRAIGIAFNNCVGNIGGVIGSYMYLESEKPKYSTGFGLSLAFGATGFIVSFILELSYKWGNSKKARLSEDEIRAKYMDKELLAMGDKSPLFRYTL
jgi:MFS family permease